MWEDFGPEANFGPHNAIFGVWMISYSINGEALHDQRSTTSGKGGAVTSFPNITK